MRFLIPVLSALALTTAAIVSMARGSEVASNVVAVSVVKHACHAAGG